MPPSLAVRYNYKSEKVAVQEEFQTIYVQPSENVELECKAIEGAPIPSITWFWQPCDYSKSCEVQDDIWKQIPTTIG